MPYSILRFTKQKGGSIRAIEAHHERKKEAYASNPDIDKEKTKDNYHLIEPKQTYYREIERRITEANCKARSNSVKFVDTLITSDNNFFKFNSEREYFERALKFMCDKIGRDNIISAVVHLDEKTPHMHLCFVPLTKDNRLSAKEILGNKNKMSQWQDQFHTYMQEQFPKLQRGKPAVETKREHIPVTLFKQATALNNELEQIERALQGINMVNATKKRDTALELLRSWFPKASNFLSDISREENYFGGFNDKEAILMNEIKQLREGTALKLHEAFLEKEAIFKEYDFLKREYAHIDNKYQNVVNQFNQLKTEFDKYKINAQSNQEDSISQTKKPLLKEIDRLKAENDSQAQSFGKSINKLQDKIQDLEGGVAQWRRFGKSIPTDLYNELTSKFFEMEEKEKQRLEKERQEQERLEQEKFEGYEFDDDDW